MAIVADRIHGFSALVLEDIQIENDGENTHGTRGFKDRNQEKKLSKFGLLSGLLLGIPWSLPHFFVGSLFLSLDYG